VEWYVVSLLVFGALVFLLAFEMPIAAALGILGLAGLFMTEGVSAALQMFAVTLYTKANGVVLATIPLFMFMGEVLFVGNIGSDLFDVAEKWVGRLHGGLASAGVAACAMFGAICGSALAATATIGTVAVPEMTKRGYNRGLATGSIAAAGALAPIIPPSILLIVYCVVTEQSVGQLFMASFIPGFVVAAAMIIQITIRVKMNPSIAPLAPRFTWKERIVSLRVIWAPLILMIAVLGTIYLGIATATEAAAVGAFVSVVIVIILKRMTWTKLRQSMLNTVKSSCMILFILVGAQLFTYWLTLLGIPEQFAKEVIGLEISRWWVMVIINIMMITLGMFLDAISIIMITMPFIFPIVIALGFSPIWFGPLLMINYALGAITPPVGLNLYMIKSVCPDVPIREIITGSLHFLIAETIALIIVAAVPQLALWLPGMMK